MAHTKSGGSSKNLKDSKPKYLGIKLFDGERTKPGVILVRQRGTKILAGKNVKCGKDHTLYTDKAGVVKFREVTKKKFNGSKRRAKVVDVII